MKTVELLPAFVWDCDHCGKENFQRGVTILLHASVPGEAAAIRASEGLPPDADLPPDLKYRVVTEPARVACRHCKTIHRSESMGGGMRELTPG